MKKSNQTSHFHPISSREKGRYALKLLCVCALMTALSVVLDGFLALPIGGGIKFTFGFLPPAIVGMLYGPIPSAIVFGLADLIAVFCGITFGPFHPGFTFCNVLMGFCFGLCLNPHPFGQKRESPSSHPKLRAALGILTPALFNNLICGMLLNTLWVSMLYGSKTYFGWFLYRLPQYAVMIPVYIILLFVLSRLAPTLRKMGFGKA